MLFMLVNACHTIFYKRIDSWYNKLSSKWKWNTGLFFKKVAIKSLSTWTDKCTYIHLFLESCDLVKTKNLATHSIVSVNIVSWVINTTIIDPLSRKDFDTPLWLLQQTKFITKSCVTLWKKMQLFCKLPWRTRSYSEPVAWKEVWCVCFVWLKTRCANIMDLLLWLDIESWWGSKQWFTAIRWWVPSQEAVCILTCMV